MSVSPSKTTAQCSVAVEGGPRRTCVGCRQVDAQSAMLRLTLAGQVLLVDDVVRSPGRGAYLHARQSCLTKAEKGGICRSFRKAIARDSITLIGAHILSRSAK